MTTIKLTDDMIRELCTICTLDEAGRHFTETAGYYNELEDLGLVTIERPVHSATGISYDRQYWSIEVSEDGLEVIEAHPELHPSLG